MLVALRAPLVAMGYKVQFLDHQFTMLVVAVPVESMVVLLQVQEALVVVDMDREIKHFLQITA
jgi:hypothetical protein